MADNIDMSQTEMNDDDWGWSADPAVQESAVATLEQADPQSDESWSKEALEEDDDLIREMMDATKAARGARADLGLDAGGPG